jgi:hypothetical protein
MYQNFGSVAFNICRSLFAKGDEIAAFFTSNYHFLVCFAAIKMGRPRKNATDGCQESSCMKSAFTKMPNLNEQYYTSTMMHGPTYLSAQSPVRYSSLESEAIHIYGQSHSFRTQQSRIENINNIGRHTFFKESQVHCPIPRLHLAKPLPMEEEFSQKCSTSSFCIVPKKRQLLPNDNFSEDTVWKRVKVEPYTVDESKGYSDNCTDNFNIHCYSECDKTESASDFRSNFAVKAEPNDTDNNTAPEKPSKNSCSDRGLKNQNEISPRKESNALDDTRPNLYLSHVFSSAYWNTISDNAVNPESLVMCSSKKLLISQLAGAYLELVNTFYKDVPRNEVSHAFDVFTTIGFIHNVRIISFFCI